MLRVEPVALDGLAKSTTTCSTSSVVWKTASKQSRMLWPWSMMFPKHRKTTRWGDSSVSRDCEEGTASRKETVEEEKENIISALMGFLKSWKVLEKAR
jgi:hypothetical protein